MNKLVSKNLIQRFKEGRKIVKAQYGNDTKKWGTYAGIPDQASDLEYQKKYSKDIAIGPGMFKDPNTGNIYSTRLDNEDNYIKISNANQPKIKEISLPSGLGQFVKDQKDSKNDPPSKKRISLVNNRWVHGIKKRDEITDVRATQQMLKDAGFDIGKFGVDGKWGRDTEAAYKAYLEKNAPTLPTSEQLIQQVPQNVPVIESVPQAGTNTIQNQLSLMQQTLPAAGTYTQTPTTPTFYNFNRSQTRDWLRKNAGGSAYAFTGEQRAAVRRILGGEGTDDDKALIQNDSTLAKALAGYLKKGGSMLPPRDIVKRFRLQRIGK